jgi:hypothetical protein
LNGSRLAGRVPVKIRSVTIVIKSRFHSLSSEQSLSLWPACLPGVLAKFREEGLAHEQKKSLAARISVLLCALVRVTGERADRRSGSCSTTTYD